MVEEDEWWRRMEMKREILLSSKEEYTEWLAARHWKSGKRRGKMENHEKLKRIVEKCTSKRMKGVKLKINESSFELSNSKCVL